MRVQQGHNGNPVCQYLGWLFIVLVLLPCLNGCTTPPREPIVVHLHVDATDREIPSDAATVRELLQQEEIQLGPLDQVAPPLWTPLQAGLQITITRVITEREERVLTNTVRIIRDEFRPPGTKVITKGQSGLEELVYRVSYDGPIVLQRTLLSRRVIRPPREEVRLVGTKGTIPRLPISGTIAYIANGDAWMMRRTSEGKRRLTQSKPLDGRAFDLSPDGRWLLYSVASPSSQGLNTLWVLDIQVLNAHPQNTGISDVYWAGWAPDGKRFAYSSALRIAGPPGYRALNDLQIVSWPALTITHVLSPTQAFLYSWRGERWAWGPDGHTLAYARADQVGLLDLSTGERQPLWSFSPFAQGDLIWLPSLSWGADGNLFAATHQGKENEPSFALVRYDLKKKTSSVLWSGPEIPGQLAQDIRTGKLYFTLATKLSSEHRRLYQSEAKTPAQLLLPDVETFSLDPAKGQLLVSKEGDLYLYQIPQGQCQPLTATGLASHPRWR